MVLQRKKSLSKILMLLVSFSVYTADYPIDLFLILDIPFNGLPKLFFNRGLRRLVQSGHDFCRINGISPVMAGAIRDKSNQVFSGGIESQGRMIVNNPADLFHQPDIFNLAVAADVVSLTDFAVFKNRP